MEIEGLTAGMKINLEDGATAEVLAPTQDGDTLRIRYVDDPFKPERVGSEDICTFDVVAGIMVDSEADLDLATETVLGERANRSGYNPGTLA